MKKSHTSAQAPPTPSADWRHSRWLWLLPVGLLLLFVNRYFISAPLPFFGYFADPEIAYILSALQLKELGYVQMTDHPGTFLQIVGAGLAAPLGYDMKEAFDLEPYNRFRTAWLCFTVLCLSSVFYLVWKQVGRGMALFCIALLLLFHDYNTLMSFGRFTPEGGFIALYSLVLVVGCISAGRGLPLRFLPAVGWGVLIGVATTIKITLWPVSLFLMGAFLCLRPKESSRSHVVAWLALLSAAILAYFVTGSVFAEDVAGQLDWFRRLIAESGRYGHDSGEGSFLPLAQIMDYSLRGFAFQNFTTLFPLAALTAWAVGNMLRPHRMELRLLSAGFLLCLLLSFVIFAKHPYQIKYLLPQTYLLIAYSLLCFGFFREELPSTRCIRVFALLLSLVAINAWVNFHILHRYNLARYERSERVIDRAMALYPADHYYFSLEVAHPLTAYGLGVREIPDFLPLLKEAIPSLTVFRERNQDYTISTEAALPLPHIEPGSLVFTQRYFNDARTQLVFHDEALGIFAYRAPSAAPPLAARSTHPATDAPLR